MKFFYMFEIHLIRYFIIRESNIESLSKIGLKNDISEFKFCLKSDDIIYYIRAGLSSKQGVREASPDTTMLKPVAARSLFARSNISPVI